MKKSLGAKTYVFPTPVFIVGTYDEDGKPNAMNAAWGGVCGSDPPALCISVRPSRKTMDNIKATGAFTVNIPGQEHVKEADYFGIASGHKEDKFKKTGLTPVKGDKVNAPVIDEFPLNIQCEVMGMMDVGEHIHIVGKIIDTMVDEEKTDENGVPDIKKIKPMTYNTVTNDYEAIGNTVAKAFRSGLEIK